MNSNPLFSILIASYNDGIFIREALNSVYNQTYTNYEIIIVDDGSTDNSRKELESLPITPNIHIFYNDKNHGCGFTKRKCVENANGELCGFLDADDILSCDAIEKMVNAHLFHPDTSLIYSRYYKCNEKLSVQYVSDHQCSIPDNSSFLEYKRGAISQFATFKKQYYDKTDGIDEQMQIAEDLDIYFKLEEVGSTLFIDEPLYYYRCGTGNNTSLDKNVIRAAYWEMVAKTNACRRRRVNIKEIEIPIIEEITNSISSYQLSTFLRSREYKLGKMLLHPVSYLKKRR